MHKTEGPACWKPGLLFGGGAIQPLDFTVLTPANQPPSEAHSSESFQIR